MLQPACGDVALTLHCWQVQDSVFGVALLSTVPFSEVSAEIMPCCSPTDTRQLNRPMQRAKFQFGGVDVVVYNVHLEFLTAEDVTMQMEFVANKVCDVLLGFIVVHAGC